MKTLFTAEAISKGGRSGTIQTLDGLLDITLGNPLVKGIEKRGPNPELLFAGAYSACYTDPKFTLFQFAGHSHRNLDIFKCLF